MATNAAQREMSASRHLPGSHHVVMVWQPLVEKGHNHDPRQVENGSIIMAGPPAWNGETQGMALGASVHPFTK